MSNLRIEYVLELFDTKLLSYIFNDNAATNNWLNYISFLPLNLKFLLIFTIISNYSFFAS